MTRNSCLTPAAQQAEREELELQRSVRSFKGVGNDEDAYNMGYSAKKVAPGSDEERYRRAFSNAEQITGWRLLKNLMIFARCRMYWEAMLAREKVRYEQVHPGIRPAMYNPEDPYATYMDGLLRAQRYCIFYIQIQQKEQKCGTHYTLAI